MQKKLAVNLVQLIYLNLTGACRAFWHKGHMPLINQLKGGIFLGCSENCFDFFYKV